MKNKKIIIFLTIVNVILIVITCSLVSKNANVIKKETITIKEMSETEYDNSITELNKSHEDYATQVQANKKRLAQAISNEKVETSENATVDEMVTNIGRILQSRTADATATEDNITAGKTAYINGKLITGTGKDNNYYYIKGKNDATIDFNDENISNIIYLGIGTTFDVTSYEGYENFTVDNFIIGALSGSDAQSGSRSENNTYAKISGFSLQKTYDESTGSLTILGYSQTAGKWDMLGYWRETVTQNVTCFAYLLY